MHLRSATKVGLSVLMSGAAFLAIWYFLQGWGLKSNTYALENVLFRDAQNIAPGAEVRMAGVEVGVVDSIQLTGDNRARLRLLINNAHTIPKGSRFIITAGGLIGEKYVSIIPRENATAHLASTDLVVGQDAVQIEDLMAKASDLAGSSNDVIREARLALAETRVAIRSIGNLVSDPQIQRSMTASLRNAEAASANVVRASENVVAASERADQIAGQFRQTASSVNSIVAGSRSQVDRTLNSVANSAQNVEDLTGTLNELLAGNNLKSDLGAALHNIRLTTERMNTIAANVERLSGDPQMTEDLKASLANIRATTAETRAASEAVNMAVQRLTGRFRPRPAQPNTNDPTGGDRPASLVRQGTVDLFQNADPGRFRADANVLFPLSPESFVFGGLRDIGEANRLNLQMGRTLNDTWNARYGIYDGRLGLGLDYGLGRPNGWSLNVYRPNKLTADLYGRRWLDADTSLMYGVESIFRNPRPTIGLRIKR